MRIKNTVFTKNYLSGSSNSSGGALFLRYTTNFKQNVTLSGNSVTYASQSIGGGGIWISHGSLEITDCNFDDNSGHIGGMLYASDVSVVIKGTTALNNKNDDIYCENANFLMGIESMTNIQRISNDTVKWGEMKRGGDLNMTFCA